MPRTTTPIKLTAAEARALRRYRALLPQGRRAVDALLATLPTTKRHPPKVMGNLLADVWLASKGGR